MKIQSEIIETEDGIVIERYSEADSTNRIASEIKDYKNLMCILADKQTGGKGRMGRSFFSPDGGLYMSVILEPDFIKCGLHVCTCAASLAVKETLEKNGMDGLSVKWVNDILKNGKKVCGILTEAKSFGGSIERIIIGIGINLITPVEGFPDDISKKAGSIDFTGDRIALAGQIVSNISKFVTLDKTDVSKSFSNVMAGINSYADVTDYADSNKIISGVIEGIDSDCNLLLRLYDGRIKTISSGEILYS